MNSQYWLIPLLLIFFIFRFCISLDTITTKKPIKDGETIVSKGEVFTLGFFSPGNSKYRYVGIWYTQVPEQTVVWVANRNNPINNTSGMIKIDDQANLVVYGRNGTVPVWSTNVSDRGTEHSSVAQLLDSGNLVLFDNITSKISWQSFDYPTKCVLPFMKLGLTRKTGLNRFLTSWKSSDDPGSGSFSYRINPNGFPQLILYNGLNPLWRGGSWTGKRLSGVPGMTNSLIFNTTFINNQDEISLMYNVTGNSIITQYITRTETNETGILEQFTWNARDNRWITIWFAPKEQCDYYKHCGQNSNCDPVHTDKFECTCLPGFEPKSPQGWFLRDGSGGCVKKRGATTCHSGEGFVKLARVKVPDTSEAVVSMYVGLRECGEKCLRNCSCVAYASAYYESGNGEIGCLTWHGDLLDTRTYADTGQDFYVRVDAVELAQWHKRTSPGRKRIVILGSIAPILFIGGLVLWFIRRKQRASKKRREAKILLERMEGDNGIGNSINQVKMKDLPLFEFEVLATATNNFDFKNKLGQGGFGPVYKGIMPEGQEIAVKRLSRASGQGLEELVNEVVVISKLQHRNLVRLLGCCIEGQERMLVYEFMPKNSLDLYMFDPLKKNSLDWKTRFKIIDGICRGLLYLHRDSRLKIIHRDLKASNILLDEHLNPKISDFGMARIFPGNEDEANTRRVVGTYGYMSPEYAMGGLFSEKSDVFSLGVLVLEIVSGRRNSSFYNDDHSLSLLSHAWKLWNEDKVAALADPVISEACSGKEINRCVHIGLLCVQELANDRPSVSTVIWMLSTENAELPVPKKPAFIARRVALEAESSESSSKPSANNVSVTSVAGR